MELEKREFELPKKRILDGKMCFNVVSNKPGNWELDHMGKSFSKRIETLERVWRPYGQP